MTITIQKALRAAEIALEDKAPRDPEKCECANCKALVLVREAMLELHQIEQAVNLGEEIYTLCGVEV